jgi:Zn finger protein HypA/HybF involved in hydrogenase expression
MRFIGIIGLLFLSCIGLLFIYSIGEMAGIGFWGMLALIGALPILLSFVITVRTISSNKNQKIITVQRWYGEMHCMSCDYTWKSRRNTPPARCARCSSSDIQIVQEIEHITVKK